MRATHKTCDHFPNHLTLCGALVGKSTKQTNDISLVTCDHCLNKLGVAMSNHSEHELRRKNEKMGEMKTMLLQLYYVITGKEPTDLEIEGMTQRLDERFDIIDNI